MKLLTVLNNGTYQPAVVKDNDVLLLGAAAEALSIPHGFPDSLREILSGGARLLKRIEQLQDLAKTQANHDALVRAHAVIPYSQVHFGPVVPSSDLVLSGSMNSRGHLREMGDEDPKFPCAFHKVRSALAGSGSTIIPPPGHGDMIDWEGEFCAVIGTRCHQVSADVAMDFVVGFTLMNDLSARDFAMPFITAKGASPTAQAWERNVLGKNYPTFAPIGPVIATKDEFSDPLTYEMHTLVNGEVMQQSTQADLVFSPAEMIAYFSQFYIFQPGDIISMGSPPGVGMARKPPRYLRPGDTVEVRVSAIGSLLSHMPKP